MANTSRIRLSPSGPFIRDVDSGDPLQTGPGSPGLVFRQLGPLADTTPLDGVDGHYILQSTAPDGFELPPGYRYDLQASCIIREMTGAGGNECTLQLRVSLDNGATWQSIPGHAGFPNAGAIGNTHRLLPNGDCTFETNVVEFDATALVAPIRVALWGISDGTAWAEHSALRVTQYVL